MTKKRTYKDRIKGVEWTFILLPKASYVRGHGNDSDASTYPYDKEVFFNADRLGPGVVRHEVFHVFVASSGTNSASLTADQMEEVSCELYEQHGPEMDWLVDKILEAFLK